MRITLSIVVDALKDHWDQLETRARAIKMELSLECVKGRDVLTHIWNAARLEARGLMETGVGKRL